jgi:hypothetical protein
MAMKFKLPSGGQIHVGDAHQGRPGEWTAHAAIVWPDGSCDTGSVAVGHEKAVAELNAAKNAHARWERIEFGPKDHTIQKTHDAPNAWDKIEQKYFETDQEVK